MKTEFEIMISRQCKRIVECSAPELLAEDVAK